MRRGAVAASPAREGVARAGGVVEGEGRRLDIVGGGVGCGHAATGKVVGNIVGDGDPLGVKRDGLAIFGSEVRDALAVGVGHCAV